MDALGKSLVLMAAVVAVVACIVPIASEPSDGAGEADGLLLYEVNPYAPKGVSVYNYGSTNVDLKNYTITDCPSLSGGSEGSITFSKSLIVEPGTFVVIADDSGSSTFVNREGVEVYYYGEDGITVDGFNPAGDGDDIYLWQGDKIIDAVCYGDKLIEDASLWASDNTVADRKNNFIHRQGTYDTDSEEDWFVYVHGQTDYAFDPDHPIDATVTPFLFPDDGGIPVYQTISKAEESLYINVYLLTNDNIYSLIYKLMDENPELDVDILVEGTPVDGDLDPYVPELKALAYKGADVRAIGMGDNPRYVQDHAKYAIVDMDTVIVTSENWTADNLNGTLDDNVYSGSNDGNRGWGAIIESTEYARYMYGVFQNDFSTEYGDVWIIKDREEYENINAAVLPEYKEPQPEGKTWRSYKAQVVPILSNDNSFDATMYYIGNAEERVYSEQQSLSSTYQDLANESPLSLMAQMASEGIDCKLIIGTGVDGYNDVTDFINKGTFIEAATLRTPYVHNKGIVADDVAIVSSVNWTPASFHNNRECAVAIYSEEIADFFAQAFLNDHNYCYTYDGFSIDMSQIQNSYPAGQEIAFTVSVSQDGTFSYRWDFGDGTPSQTTDIPRVVHTPQITGDAQVLTLTVTVTNEDGVSTTVTKDYTVLREGASVPDPDQPGTGTSEDDGDSAGFLSGNLTYLIPIIVVILAIIGAVAKMAGKGKKSGKKRK